MAMKHSDVFQMPRTPPVQVATGEISQLSCGISQRHAPFWSTKMAEPIKRFLSSLYLYHVGNFNVDFKSSYTLDYIATLLCCVVLFVFELVC